MINKKVLVTGAGRGIGQSTCLRLAKNNNLIIAVSRTKKDLTELKKKLDKINGLDNIIIFSIRPLEIVLFLEKILILFQESFNFLLIFKIFFLILS